MTALPTAMEEMEALTELLLGDEVANEIIEDSDALFSEIQ